MLYRRRASPLHAARAGVGLLWCLSLLCAVLISSSPWPLLALSGAVIAAAHAAGCGPTIRRTLLFALPMALSVCLINALVSRDGLTVIWRFGNVPLLGDTNVTLEATVYGAVLGLKAANLILVSALYSAAVDPDQLLSLMRRFSLRSALTASIATRMVPLMRRDAARLADAQRCRPGAPTTRAQLLKASSSGVLDRAFDVALALEVRGFGAKPQAAAAIKPAAHSALYGRQAWSRHDYSFTASAATLLAIALLIRFSGVAPFWALTTLSAPLTLGCALGCVALVWAALLPFLDRRGVAT